MICEVSSAENLLPEATGLPAGQEVDMIPMTVLLDEKTAEFYAKVAAHAGRTVETVLADSLFKLAGELSLEALAAKQRKGV